MKRKNIFWGLMFLLGAVALLMNAMGLLIGLNFWSILLSVCCVAIFVKGVMKRSWGTMLFALAFLAIINQDLLGLEKMTWTLLGVAALGTIGLNMLIPLKHKHKFGITVNGDHKEEYEVSIAEDGGETVNWDNIFGSTAKYIQSDSLRRVNADSVFGSIAIYFENAVLMNHRATVNVDSVFGSVELYIPADWHVIVNVSTVFGGAKEFGHDNPNGENVLEINGDSVFGSLEIHYI